MPLLRLTRDGVEIQSLDLSQLGKSDVVIGRAENADVRLDDRAVGRSHAVLRFGAKGVAIQRTSKFGKLTLNGQDIDEALIHEGDVVHLADYTVHIVQDALAQKVEPVLSTAILDMQGAAPIAEAKAEASAPVHLAATPAAAVVDSLSPLQEEQRAVISEVPEPKLIDVPVENTSTGQLETSQQPIGSLSSQETGSLSQSQGFQNLEEAASINVELAQNDSPEDRTALLPQGQMTAELLFKPGEANVEVFEVQKDEVTIGRGSNCDIVLGDKKSSRKHAVIKRAGAAFVVRDLSSANGTYVNGELITEKEIQGGDMLRIGDTEFAFKAMSKEYEAQQGDLLAVPAIESTNNTPQVEMPSKPSGVAYSMSAGSATAAEYMSGAEALAAQASAVNQSAAQHIPGMTPNSAPAMGEEANSKSLLAKFRKLSPVTRYGIMLLVMLFFYYGSEEMNKDSAQNGRSPAASKISNDPQNVAFNALAPEKKQFIVNTYQLAFDLYTQEKYEESLYEIRKVLQILPNGYKQAKDIESYAQKAIDQLAEQAERRKRQENEEKVRSEVAALVTQAQDLVDKGDYTEAKIIFSQILEKDPENPVVQRLKSAIDEKEEQARAAEELKKEKLAKKEQLEKILSDGRALLKSKKYYGAIERMADVPTAGYQDEGMLREAQDIVKEAKRRLREDTKPFLDEAKAALTSGDLPKARDAFLKALKVDYKNAAAKEGLAGVRKTLFEKARRVYTEGLIAESISNYREARAKFGKCLEIAMADDIYHGRCERKFKRYDFLDRSIATESADGGENAAPEAPIVPEGSYE